MVVLNATSWWGGVWRRQSLADCISGSWTATNTGQGLSYRETLGLKHITGWTALDIGYSGYERQVLWPSWNRTEELVVLALRDGGGEGRGKQWWIGIAISKCNLLPFSWWDIFEQSQELFLKLSQARPGWGLRPMIFTQLLNQIFAHAQYSGMLVIWTSAIRTCRSTKWSYNLLFLINTHIPWRQLHDKMALHVCILLCSIVGGLAFQVFKFCCSVVISLLHLWPCLHRGSENVVCNFHKAKVLCAEYSAEIGDLWSLEEWLELLADLRVWDWKFDRVRHQVGSWKHF